MFTGDDYIRFRTTLTEEQIEDVIRDAFYSLGRVKFYRHGEFEVFDAALETSMTTATITGRLSPGRKSDQWEIEAEYIVRPTATLWVLFAVGIFFVGVFSALFLLIPSNRKSELERRVDRALRRARDDARD